MLDGYRVVPSNEAEANLLRSVDRDALEDKESVLEVLRYMKLYNDHGSNNAGKCYEGCPPQIGDDFLASLIEELENKELIIITWIAEEGKQGTDLKKELLTAFQQANNHRLMQVIDRNKLIDESNFFNRPDKIPMVHEKTLTEEEILNFVSPELKEEIKSSEAYDQMMGRLKEAETGAIKTEFWDTMGQSTASTASSMYNAVRNKAVRVDDRIVNGETASTNYAAFGLTNQQVDQYIKNELAKGESVFWISAKLYSKEISYNVWNFATWGALKEHDMLAVQYEDGEISKGRKNGLQILNGFIAVAESFTFGSMAKVRTVDGVTSSFFTQTAKKASIKAGVTGSLVSMSINGGMQYIVNGKVDSLFSVAITGVVGYVLPSYGLKGMLAVTSTGVYLDDLRQNKSLVDHGYSLSVSGIMNSLFYGLTNTALKNKNINKKGYSEYKEGLFKNNGHNYIHNYKPWDESKELLDSMFIGGAMGNTANEYFSNKLKETLKKNEK